MSAPNTKCLNTADLNRLENIIRALANNTSIELATGAGKIQGRIALCRSGNLNFSELKQEIHAFRTAHNLNFEI